MRRLFGMCLALFATMPVAWAALDGPALPPRVAKSGLRFEVTVREGLLPGPRDGRLLIFLGPKKDPEPKESVNGDPSATAPPILGRDVKGLAPGAPAIVDYRAASYPVGNLRDVPPGEYYAQAVFDHNRDLKLPDAPGNLYGPPVRVFVKHAPSSTIKLELTKQVPLADVPADTERVKYVKLRSERLSKFHERSIFLRAAVVLPKGHDRDKERRYPLRVSIGGYGTRFTEAGDRMEDAELRRLWLAKDTPRFLMLQLDGAGPFGDPYQVNSANHGPYGDAVTQELIPHVEKLYRGIGKGHARVLDGASTGGWVSLALQIFYPDFFNGTWSHCPDPVDFRSFELINIYKDDNAYANVHGCERPSARDLEGDVRWTVRNEVQREIVLGTGDNWALSGKDWGAWNATFGPRGADGLPRPIWDGKTGKIDRGVLDHWQKYDLRLVLQRNWATLGPKLRGKLRIWVGEADDYFLNNAVHRLDEFLTRARPAFGGKITYGARKGHFWRGLSEKEMLEEMGEAVERGRK